MNLDDAMVMELVKDAREIVVDRKIEEMRLMNLHLRRKHAVSCIFETSAFLNVQRFFVKTSQASVFKTNPLTSCVKLFRVNSHQFFYCL